MKPTQKANREMTHHKDGSVSYFDTEKGEWARGDVNAYLNRKRAARAAADRADSIACMASERDNGDRFW